MHQRLRSNVQGRTHTSQWKKAKSQSESEEGMHMREEGPWD